MRSLQAMKYHTMSAPVAWKKSMVLAVVEADLLVFTVALVSSDAVAAAEANDIVPAPSVFKTSPELPSAVGILNVVPPDVKIKFVPSDLTDSFASTNCIALFEPKVTVLLNVAAPASDISKDNAVICDPPSLPKILKSLSDILLTISDKEIAKLIDLGELYEVIENV